MNSNLSFDSLSATAQMRHAEATSNQSGPRLVAEATWTSRLAVKLFLLNHLRC
jgi:hypothetical protein